MAAHLRQYTINKGQMDQWIAHFNEKLVPLMSAHGMSVKSSWTNVDRTEFIWIREYRDGDIDACEKSFYGSDEWNEIDDFTRAMLAKIEVKVIESA